MASDSLMSGGRKEFGSKSAKDLLCGRQNLLIALATPGHIEQPKQNPLGADPQRVVEIAGDPFP